MYIESIFPPPPPPNPSLPKEQGKTQSGVSLFLGMVRSSTTGDPSCCLSGGPWSVIQCVVGGWVDRLVHGRSVRSQPAAGML